MIFPDPVLPYRSAYAAARAAQSEMAIWPDHICEVVEPRHTLSLPAPPHHVTVDWPALPTEGE